MTKRYKTYRDGLESWTDGEIIEGPENSTVEILYPNETSVKKIYFIELCGEPGCAHGETIQDAYNEAKNKRDFNKPLTEKEKKKYRAKDFKFNASLFRRITKACRAGINEWLDQKSLDHETEMTLDEIKNAGAKHWAAILEKAIKSDYK